MSYSFNSRIRYSEIDENGVLSVHSLVNYFQDCSTFQTEDIGLGISLLKERNLAWILSSWQIIIDHLPLLGEQVKVTTIPYDFRSFYGFRNFVLEDGQGKAAWANSVWVLFDFVKGVPVRVDEDMIRRYGLDQMLPMENAPRKIRIRPEEWSGPVKGAPFAVTKEHLDTNHHVNNGQYIRMALCTLPEGKRIRQLRVEYRAQARLGDVIVPVIRQKQDTYLIQLQSESGNDYAVAEMET